MFLEKPVFAKDNWFRYGFIWDISKTYYNDFTTVEANPVANRSSHFTTAGIDGSLSKLCSLVKLQFVLVVLSQITVGTKTRLENTAGETRLENTAGKHGWWKMTAGAF